MIELKQCTLTVDGPGLQLIWKGLDQLPHGMVAAFVQHLQGQVQAQLQAAQAAAVHPIDPPHSPEPPEHPTH